jgi:hypothetical protein
LASRFCAAQVIAGRQLVIEFFDDGGQNAAVLIAVGT